MNPSPMPTRTRDPNPVMVTRTWTRKINGVEVESTYGYIAVKEGDPKSGKLLWDAELIAFANEREARLKRTSGGS